MNQKTKLTNQLSANIALLQSMLPLSQSFDFTCQPLCFGEIEGFFIGLNGFYNESIFQDLFKKLSSDLSLEPLSNSSQEKLSNTTQAQLTNTALDQLTLHMDFPQVSAVDTAEDAISQILCGPCLLLLDGSPKGYVIDARKYPTRGITEPDDEKMTRGAKDGFVETLLTNTNLIRRRIKSTHLIFEHHTVGTESKTDIALAYLDNTVDQALLHKLIQKIENIQATTLTMGAKSLEELLVKKRFFNPLPSMQLTERPDIACSYLSEGHILILVDNSPLVLILPCTIFHFTQSPEDYYKSPLIGTYFRLARFLCIPVSLLLMPTFLLITAYYPEFTQKWNLLSTGSLGPIRITFYVFAVEFLLDLFKYSASLSSSRFSGPLSIVGGLLIGDIAVSLNWASEEVLFYAAVTLLASLALSSVELAEALRVYRIFLICTTAFWGTKGYVLGMTLVSLSIITTPTFAGQSYFWPLVPFNPKAMAMLLFRLPTSKAQPSNIWRRP